MLSDSYDRTPPCSMAIVTQCSQFFHEILINGLEASTEFYYQIEAANGTTASDILKFTTARAAGDSGEFTAIVLADMGYANAAGTRHYIQKVRFWKLRSFDNEATLLSISFAPL
jgi:hypothetical protein